MKWITHWCAGLIITPKPRLKFSMYRWARRALYAAADATTALLRKSAARMFPASALPWAWNASFWRLKARTFVSGIGFAMGMERILLALESQNLLPEHKDGIDAFIVCPNQDNFELAFKTAIALRQAGLKTEFDFMARSMKAQMKQAGRLNAKFAVIFGDGELERGAVTLKDMADSTQTEIPVDEIVTILQTEVQKYE